MYGLEACPLVKSDLSPLDFAINRFLWNYLGQIISMLLNVANTIYFGFDLHSAMWLKRVQKFEAKFKKCDNLFCKLTVYK